jgi:ankyrin repeat protein
LIDACAKGTVATTLEAIVQGADLDFGGYEGKGTALHASVQANSIVCAELLLKNGAHISCSNDEGKNCLHLSAELNNAKMTTYLISRGVDRTAVTQQNKTAFDLAEERKSEDVVKYFSSLGMHATSIKRTVRNISHGWIVLDDDEKDAPFVGSVGRIADTRESFFTTKNKLFPF